jgi:hypothetical protein
MTNVKIKLYFDNGVLYTDHNLNETPLLTAFSNLSYTLEVYTLELTSALTASFQRADGYSVSLPMSSLGQQAPDEYGIQWYKNECAITSQVTTLQISKGSHDLFLSINYLSGGNQVVYNTSPYKLSCVYAINGTTSQLEMTPMEYYQYQYNLALNQKENLSNKVQNLDNPNATTYPSTQAVASAFASNVKLIDITGMSYADTLALVNAGKVPFYYDSNNRFFLYTSIDIDNNIYFRYFETFAQNNHTCYISMFSSSYGPAVVGHFIVEQQENKKNVLSDSDVFYPTVKAVKTQVDRIDGDISNINDAITGINNTIDNLETLKIITNSATRSDIQTAVSNGLTVILTNAGKYYMPYIITGNGTYQFYLVYRDSANAILYLGIATLDTSNNWSFNNYRVQDKITNSNKLSSDLVDDTGNTHKFVTQTDINNWNAIKGLYWINASEAPSYSAVSTALSNGLLPIVKESNAIYVYTTSSASNHTFSRADASGSQPKITQKFITHSNTWGDNSYNLQTKLTFDNTPTSSSTNPVTSGGVYNALGDRVDKDFSGAGYTLANAIGDNDYLLINVNGTAKKILWSTIASGLGYSDHFLGTYSSLSALETAYPTATPGDYANISTTDPDDPTKVIIDIAVWDETDNEWQVQGTSLYVTQSDFEAYQTTVTAALNGKSSVTLVEWS